MFKKTIKPEDTLVLVTHKMEMVELVDRLIVVNKNQIVTDAVGSSNNHIFGSRNTTRVRFNNCF
jgi:energy-coupling factor transporter ATP-binding protein EcfA2